MSNKWKVFWVVSFALVLFFQACGLHSWEELLISKTDEKVMGREFDSLVRVKHKDVVDPAKEELFIPTTAAEIELYNYYRERAQEIVSKISNDDFNSILVNEKLCRSELKDLSKLDDADRRKEKVACNKNNFFEFNIIRSPTINAFAVPGGYVYFYTNILKNFRSESELMSVFGHEVGHVVLHHSRERMAKQAALYGGIDVLLGGGLGGVIAQAGGALWLLGNSRDNESEADVMGFNYTNAIGVSSVGLSDFFGRGLKSYDTITRTCDPKEESSWLDALSTHPPSCNRVQANTERIQKANQTEETHPKNRVHNGKTYRDFVEAAKL
jgi:hypothetical protein